MKTLVTGAAGFIGAAVCDRLLALGDEVIGVDNLNDYYAVSLKEARLGRVRNDANGRFSFYQVDFGDQSALMAALERSAIERIVHLGAQPGVRYSLINPHAYIHANVLGHLNLLELARQRGVVHMVYASSSSVYGGNEKVPFAVEDRTDHPWSLYAATKKTDELISETYSHLYRMSLTGLRFFTVYGQWGRPDMMPWIFTDKILRGAPLPVFNGGDMWRDFTFIDDIVTGVIACLNSPPKDDGQEKPGGSRAPHAIYNIGNNQAEPLMKVIGIIEEACGRKAKLELMPMQPGDVPRTFADLSAIGGVIGYCPTTSVEEGFPTFVHWFKKYHMLT